jgi:hypothetical protein
MAADVKIKIRATDKTKRAFASVNKSMKSMQGRIIGLVGVGGIGLLINKTIQVSDQTAKLSKRLGISTEALSQYRHVADLSGVSFESLTNGMKKLQKSASDASVGLSTPKKAFEALNIEVESFKRLAPELQFEVFADAVSKVANQSDKTRIAMDVMGRAGSDLLTVMNDGSGAIRAMREEADRLGLTLSADQAKKYEDVNDSIARMKNLSAGLALTMTSELIPSIEKFNQAVVKITTDPQNMELWLKKVAFHATSVAFEFEDLIDLAVAWGLVAGKMMTGDRAGAIAIAATRIQTRKSLDEDLAAFAVFLDKKRELIKKANAGVDVGGGGSAIITDGLSETQIAQAIEDEKTMIYVNGLVARLEAERINAEEIKSINDGIAASFSAGMGNAVADVIVDNANAADAMKNLLKAITKQVIASYVALAVKRVFFSTQATAAAIIEANALGLSWATPAALASTATLGGAAATGLTALTLAVGQANALAKASQLPGREHGGPVFAGQSVIVGETRPEVFTPNVSGFISPNTDGVGVGNTINLNMNVDAIDVESFTDKLKNNPDAIWNVIIDRMNEEGLSFT